MTLAQTKNLRKFASFTSNIGKLKVGKSASFTKATPEATVPYGKVTCTTKGVRPRIFTVEGSAVLPNGQFTYKAIMASLLSRI